MSETGVHNITAKADFDKLIADPSLAVLDCMAVWCGPCKVIAPKIVAMSKDLPNVRFYKIDVDELPELAQELGVRAMPTFILIQNGEKVGEVVGANEKAIRASIEKALA